MVKENVFRDEFAKSLKTESAEEIVDIYLYRPLGFILAKILSKTRITPNIVTLTGIFWGLLAGYFLSRGTAAFFVYGALIYQVANVFDCADGQLARLTSVYSDFGRILDGVVDYFMVSAVFVGSIVGLYRSQDAFLITHHYILVIIFAGLSTIVACVLYDKLKSKYINLASGEEVVKENAAELQERRKEEPLAVKRFFYSLYIFYLRAQCFMAENISLKRKARNEFTPYDSRLYRERYLARNSKLLRAWSLVGLSSRALFFLLFALAGRFFWYFLFLAGPLNGVLLVLFYVQYRTEKSILAEIQDTE